jgi:uncharacterized phage-associated protein
VFRPNTRTPRLDMVSAREVALFLIRLAAADPDGELMTPLRLQKLLYYCQGWYLAWYGKPLFSERVEAWREGPVVRAVYQQPWAKGRNPIEEKDIQFDELEFLSEDQKRAITQVWSYYRQFSALGLRDKTHKEAPWKNHYHPDSEKRCDEEIPREEMSAFFGSEYHKLTGDIPGTAESFKTSKTFTLEQIRKELGC